MTPNFYDDFIAPWPMTTGTGVRGTLAIADGVITMSRFPNKTTCHEIGHLLRLPWQRWYQYNTDSISFNFLSPRTPEGMRRFARNEINAFAIEYTLCRHYEVDVSFEVYLPNEFVTQILTYLRLSIFSMREHFPDRAELMDIYEAVDKPFDEIIGNWRTLMGKMGEIANSRRFELLRGQ